MNNAKKTLIIGGTTEARLFGTFLKNEGIDFTFTLTSKPLKEYPFTYRITKLFDIHFVDEAFKIKFEDGVEHYDFIVDLAHPHANSISQIVENACKNRNLSRELWRFQRTSCLDKRDSVESCEEMAYHIMETKSQKILSFMGHKGSQRLAECLNHRQYNCEIHLRSIKSPDFKQEHVRLIPIHFNPSDMNSETILKGLISEIKPTRVVLKDSGKFGGTDIKRKILKETKTRFIGLAMPEKKGGTIFTDFEEMKEKVMGRLV